MRPRGRHLAPSFRRINRGWALPLAVAFSLFLTSVALADNLVADADALATSPPSPNGVTATQQAGTTVDYDLSAYVKETGNANDDVFPGSVSVTITRSGAWLALDSGLPAAFTFNGYNANQAGKIRITVPCDATGTQTMQALLVAGTSTNGKSLNPNSVTLNYTITAGAPAHSDCAPTPPSNRPPTADAGGPYVGFEGSAVAIDGTGSTDPDDDELTYAWSVDSALCSFNDAAAPKPNVTCTDNGAFNVTVTVDDGRGGSDIDSAALTIDNVAPSIDALGFSTTTAVCGTDNASLAFAYSDRGTNDTHTVSVQWGDGTSETLTGSPAGHTYAAAGMYTATLTVTDDDGGSTNGNASFTVNYTIVDGGVLPPIKADGTSVFKYGSTVPVKIKIQDCDGSYPSNLAPKIQYQKISGATPGGLVDPLSTSAADTTGVMRYTAAPDFQYIYNLATRSLPDATATYKVVITIPATGQMISSANWGVK